MSNLVCFILQPFTFSLKLNKKKENLTAVLRPQSTLIYSDLLSNNSASFV